MSFLDTNVLLYREDLDSPQKRDVADALLVRLHRERSAVVSAQVLEEYYHNAVHKLGLTPELARARVRLYGVWDLVPIDLALVLGAIDLHQLERLSFWDALIVRAASASGCKVLYTEDLQDGRVIDGVRVKNPFAGL